MLVIFYFINTKSGNKNLKYLIENYLSKETSNKIVVHLLDVDKYPYIIIELEINDKAEMILKGKITPYGINMKYHLKGDSFKFNNVYLKDKIDIRGKLWGSFSYLHIKGYGYIFGGEVKYSFINIPKKIKDFNITMKKVDIHEISYFLEKKSFISGLADIDANFNSFTMYGQEGIVKININKASLQQPKDINFALNSIIYFHDIEYRYTAKLNSNIGKIILENGYYHIGKKVFNVDYKASFKDLSYFKKIFKQKYNGGFNSKGNIVYDTYSDQIMINGHTEQFGGLLEYIYKEDKLAVKLKAVPLESILKTFSYPILFSSKLYGSMNFNIKYKMFLANFHLKETHFIKSRLTDILYDKLGINMLADTYNESYFSSGYEKGIFSSTLKIDNGKDYIYFTDIKMNSLNNKIYSMFKIKIQGEEIYGKIHGSIAKPKVWIDRGKFFKYQIDKYIKKVIDS
jgi:hypothetical protein